MTRFIIKQFELLSVFSPTVHSSTDFFTGLIKP